MRRTKAASTYGWRTILSGTLLPSRALAPIAAPLVRRAMAEGHEVAVHAWDHVEWHDRLPRWNRERVRLELGRALAAFEAAAGHPARALAAPGWMISADSLAVEDDLGLLYASDGRGDEPFFPEHAGIRYRTLQIPTTLPTWDETLGTSAGEEDLVETYRRGIRRENGTAHVHTIHAEFEGGPHSASFSRLLDAWLADGVRFVTLEDIADEKLRDRPSVPVLPFVLRSIEGRGGEVATALGRP